MSFRSAADAQAKMPRPALAPIFRQNSGRPEEWKPVTRAAAGASAADSHKSPSAGGQELPGGRKGSGFGQYLLPVVDDGERLAGFLSERRIHQESLAIGMYVERAHSAGHGIHLKERLRSPEFEL